ADERARPLVEVVEAAQEGARPDDDRRPRTELLEPLGEVADGDDLLEDAVLQGGQEEDGDGPPVVGERRGLDLDGDAESAAEGVEGEARDPDERRETEADAH